MSKDKSRKQQQVQHDSIYVKVKVWEEVSQNGSSAYSGVAEFGVICTFSFIFFYTIYLFIFYKENDPFLL